MITIKLASLEVSFQLPCAALKIKLKYVLYDLEMD